MLRVVGQWVIIPASRAAFKQKSAVTARQSVGAAIEISVGVKKDELD
jgi:uncharacterized protein YqcC (DUF446 family)